MASHAEIWQCPDCGAELDVSALGFYAQVSCPDCGQSEYVHTMLSNFRVDGVLGIGGMSVVLRARDLVLDRSVAIKVLNDAYRNQPDRISRFENECAMMAKVRHENVVSVYSAGRARRQFYIAMELVEGCDLDTMVHRDGPLSQELAIDYAIQIVKGLEAANKSGLLHRDMKPGNVIITPDGHAKVLDFGLALGQKDEDTEEIIWATPYYVPPETLERKDEDARTDIYALGMTLRFLLTGSETFKENTTSVTELLQCKA
ncbi:MAG: serine/threonine protein kinase, partial [Akkermansia sp.]|nr:serine/threonine protein kinase [Akkermansia sp.]